MSKLEITGKIKLIGETIEFDSGFRKREFVITTNDEYPQDIKFEVIKDKVTELTRFKEGDEVRVGFNLRGSEYKDRYYVNLQAWLIADTRQETDYKKEEVKEDIPF